jgi:hypothetical protein
MAGPTPHELGLSGNPDLSWTGIGIEQPTPADLGWASDPDLSWEAFEAAYPAGPQPDPPEPEAG